MNRKEIKEKSKIILKENLGSFWSGYGIILVISLLLSFGIELLFDNKSTIYIVLTLISSCFSMTLSVGFYSYIIKMVRKEDFNRKDIFNYVDKVLPIVSISLLIAIFCLLGLFLFIIPGIILALSFTFAYLIYSENQEITPMECLGKSKDLINGYKIDYFVFNLSFFGLIILSVLTLGILFIWTIPYISIAQVVYYDELKKLQEK